MNVTSQSIQRNVFRLILKRSITGHGWKHRYRCRCRRVTYLQVKCPSYVLRPFSLPHTSRFDSPPTFCLSPYLVIRHEKLPFSPQIYAVFRFKKRKSQGLILHFTFSVRMSKESSFNLGKYTDSWECSNTCATFWVTFVKI